MAAKMRWDTRKTGKGIEEALWTDGEFMARQVELLLDTLGNMKGAAMKFAQMLHAHAHLLPPEARAVIDKFDQHVPPMDEKQILAVFKREFGKTPQQLFAHFEPVPLGTASIGQVHAATTRDGEDVVVKIQYPGIDRTIRSDLSNLKLMVAAGGMWTERTRLDRLVLELSDRLWEELDYRNEVKNIARFRELYGDQPELVFPHAIEPLCSRRILTLKRLEGLPIEEAEQRGEEEKLGWSRSLMRFYAATVLQKGVLHADPHPGNFLFMEDGKLGVLDFGSVKELPKAFHHAHTNLVYYALKDDFDSVWRWMIKGGFLTSNSTREHAEVMYKALRYSLGPMMKEDFRFGRDLVFTRIGELDWSPRESSERAGMPKDALFLNRTSFGVYGLLCRLKSEDNWAEAVKDLIPETPLGEEPGALPPLPEAEALPLPAAGNGSV